MSGKDWVAICQLSDIAKNTGVCADFNGEQVAIFHLFSKTLGEQSEVKAVGNYDPFGKANVLSRGLITEKEKNYHIASPLLKQEFCLATGQCLQDESVVIPTYNARVKDNMVELCAKTAATAVEV
ncbi:nitrite reductase small subunit NirD [Litorilituus lipolyticus]|uniref:Nitrite reductase small subunit NirD n=2 Tax=Litorilituus lipolyticus TaxID=2491017 RepID=A0A502LDI8_9GAMM|nr:nitrite reductase small subunit NirD [Litorilituus lipolyticus]